MEINKLKWGIDQVEMKEILPKNWAIIVICYISEKGGRYIMQQLSRYVTALHSVLDLFSNHAMWIETILSRYQLRIPHWLQKGQTGC
jgi:hypothetical protein